MSQRCTICGTYHQFNTACGGTPTFAPTTTQQDAVLSEIQTLKTRISELEPLERFMQAWGEKRPSELSDADFIADVKRDIAECTKDREEMGYAGVCDHCHSFSRLLQMIGVEE